MGDDEKPNDKPDSFPQGTEPGTRRKLGRCVVTIIVDPGHGKVAWVAERVGHVLELRKDSVLVQLDSDREPREVPLCDVETW
jgi:hypothetical protein